MPPSEPSLPGVANRAAAREAGWSEDQITRRLQSGAWTRLRHGRFMTARGLAEHRRWQAEVVAHVAEHRRALVLSHAHAARAWGWPAPLEGWGPLTFTDTSGPTRNGRLRVAVAPLDSHERVQAAVPVTAPARTVVDCARTLPERDALAIADAALSSGRVTRAALVVTLDRAKGWPGAPRARRVVALADGRRESPLESWSAWAFDQHGVPRPLWQVEIADVSGEPIGRADCWWREGVAGEADGRGKYRTRALRRGSGSVEDYEAVLHEERLREMRMRRTGALVVRWEPRDVLVPRAADLARYITTQLALAAAAPFEGFLRLP